MKRSERMRPLPCKACGKTDCFKYQGVLCIDCFRKVRPDKYQKKLDNSRAYYWKEKASPTTGVCSSCHRDRLIANKTRWVCAKCVNHRPCSMCGEIKYSNYTGGLCVDCLRRYRPEDYAELQERAKRYRASNLRKPCEDCGGGKRYGGSRYCYQCWKKRNPDQYRRMLENKKGGGYRPLPAKPKPVYKKPRPVSDYILADNAVQELISNFRKGSAS